MAATTLSRIAPSFWIKVAAAAALVALGDRLFYVSGGIGSTMGAFALAWLAATLLVHPAVLRDRRALAAAGLAASYCIALFDDPNLLALALFCIALAFVALLPRFAAFDDAWHWAGRLIAYCTTSLFGPLADLRKLRRLRTRSQGRILTGMLPLLALPIVGGAVFLALFASANPLIGNAIGNVAWPTIDIFLVFRAGLWLLLFTLVWSSLRPRALRWTRSLPDFEGMVTLPGVSVASVTLSLIVFNALFALQNGLDIAFLWSGAVLPQGVTMADYVHRGAYPLIATALLAGAFVLVALRPGSATAAAPLVRRLVTLWTAQNIFLVASSILRTLDYIDAYSLTRLRIAALAWMALVAAGLALILWRMLKGRSASWLINANALAAGIVLSIATVVDLGAVAATWNVSHAREVGGRGAALDLCYLNRLGSSSLTALVELERRKLQPAFRDRVAAVRSEVAAQTRRGQYVGGWTWRDQRRLDRAGPLGMRKAGEGVNRACDGRVFTPPQPEVFAPPPAPPEAPVLPPPPPAAALAPPPPPPPPPPLTQDPQR